MGKNIRNLLATIIVVNFNNKKYLPKCLKSIFLQKYKKIEIIVVDDQSTDDSIKLLNKIKNKIKIIKTKGDKIQHLSFDKIEGKGFFTKEIEISLLNKNIDLAW